MSKSSYGNPFLDVDMDRASAGESTMTMGGVVVKTLISFAVLLCTAFYVWGQYDPAVGMASISELMWLGIIGGLVVGLITIFAQVAQYTTLIYAGLEGLAIGGISAWAETQYPGIVLQATSGTFGVFAMMLLLYSVRIIKPSGHLVRGVVAATGAVFLIYVIDLVGQMFFGFSVPLVHSNSWMGIGFTLLVVGIAAFNLIVDFMLIEGNIGRAKKRFEWYCAFSLMVTLIWLYLEILKLIIKLRSKD